MLVDAALLPLLMVRTARFKRRHLKFEISCTEKLTGIAKKLKDLVASQALIQVLSNL